jgi:hypothetical protein
MLLKVTSEQEEMLGVVRKIKKDVKIALDLLEENIAKYHS